MNWFKFILILLGLILGAWLLFFILGIVQVILWYAFILGVVGIAGYVGYQLFKPDKKPELKGKETTAAQIEIDSTRSDRTLEEYKRKYLNK
jgi:4-hydroxybenzoate polyprenyltransferase